MEEKLSEIRNALIDLRESTVNDDKETSLSLITQTLFLLEDLEDEL